MAKEWTKSHGGCLPSTRDEKKQFKVENAVPLSIYYFSAIVLEMFLILNVLGPNQSPDDING